MSSYFLVPLLSCWVLVCALNAADPVTVTIEPVTLTFEQNPKRPGTHYNARRVEATQTKRAFEIVKLNNGVVELDSSTSGRSPDPGYRY